MSETSSKPRSRKRSPAKTGPASKKPAAPRLRTYASAVRYLFNHVNHERMRMIRLNTRMFKLERMKALCEALGDPQDSIRAVHIVGTKGKGSTVAMLTSSLKACGYVVGSYTSPHLVDLRERICINDAWIPQSEFTQLMNRVGAAAESVKDEIEAPSFFELMTGIAFCYFADQAVDIAVIEAGLGGRLDCTSVITPIVTAVTAISHDHTHILGDTIEKIAREKAGAFKPGVPVVSVRQPVEAEEVFREVAEEIGTTFEICGKDIDFSSRFETTADIGPHTRVCVTTETSKFEHLACPLPGEHQSLNCGLALALLDKLRTRGLHMEDNDVIHGLEETKLAGRMDIVWKDPQILVDGAHNTASVTALIRAMGAYVPYDSLIMIFGCAEDKDVDDMLKAISLGADKIIFVRAKSNPRSMYAEDLQRRFAEQSGKMTQVADSIHEALTLATRAASREDLICVTGSFYLVGEVKKHLSQSSAR
ncbi:MAG: bifunctional folylpolyglutamate synthase/dihydrofolate synthase [Phycisphaerales bacterium]|nr:bifunctional folylpolyglutamate synthase/dihydrofolate synthase [Phycisphaerales bacterium]